MRRETSRREGPQQPCGPCFVQRNESCGRPGTPLAFLAGPGQGVNYLRNVWHGVLTPLARPARFLIVDRIGSGNNLEEFTYPEPWTVTAA